MGESNGLCSFMGLSGVKCCLSPKHTYQFWNRLCAKLRRRIHLSSQNRMDLYAPRKCRPQSMKVPGSFASIGGPSSLFLCSQFLVPILAREIQLVLALPRGLISLWRSPFSTFETFT